MDLSRDNLAEIYDTLIQSKNGAERVMHYFNFQDPIEATPEKRQLLNSMFDSMSAYLLEISHIDSFFQSCDMVDVQHKSITPTI